MNGKPEYFFDSRVAYQYLMDPEFIALHQHLERLMIEEEQLTDEPAPNLPPENDYGDTEYKLKLCNMTMFKLDKRTTQMRFRLVEGHGTAFYEIGVHDNGDLIGISFEECCHSMLALFYMSK